MSEVNTLSVQAADALLKQTDQGAGVILLDMRDRPDYDLSHHPQAIHLSDSNMKALLMSTPREMTVLILCYHGHSSIEMARLFEDFGFQRCYSVEGGFEAWKPLMGVGTAVGDASINRPGRFGITPLMEAVRQGQLFEVRRLLSLGADINQRNDDGNNALWFACRNNDADGMRLLIGQGIDIDNQNLNGTTALIYAASAGLAEMVQMLLASGADTRLRTLDEFSALDVAGNREIMKLLRATTQVAVGQ